MERHTGMQELPSDPFAALSPPRQQQHHHQAASPERGSLRLGQRSASIPLLPSSKDAGAHFAEPASDPFTQGMLGMHDFQDVRRSPCPPPSSPTWVAQCFTVLGF